MSYTALQQNHVTLQSPHILQLPYLHYNEILLQVTLMLQQSGATSKLAGLSFHKIQSVHGKTYKHQL